jgi:hypothetical protein
LGGFSQGILAVFGIIAIYRIDAGFPGHFALLKRTDMGIVAAFISAGESKGAAFVFDAHAPIAAAGTSGSVISEVGIGSIGSIGGSVETALG